MNRQAMKNIVFDLGGVVFARNKNTCRPELIDFFSFVRAEKMPEFWEEYDRGTLTRDEVTDVLCRLKGCDRDTCAALIDEAIDRQEPIAPTERLIGDLKAAGYRLYVLSNMSREFIDFLRRVPVYRRQARAAHLRDPARPLRARSRRDALRRRPAREHRGRRAPRDPRLSVRPPRSRGRLRRPAADAACIAACPAPCTRSCTPFGSLAGALHADAGSLREAGIVRFAAPPTALQTSTTGNKKGRNPRAGIPAFAVGG